MSATVHRLFPGQGNSPHPSPENLAAPMASHPLIEALSTATTPILVKQVQALFEGADDALFGMSQREAANPEQRSSFDIMRLLRLERARIEAEFKHQIEDSFHAAADASLAEFDLDRLSIQQTEELEERIAVGNLVTKAEGLHRAQLEDVSARIVHMIRDLGVPIARRALTPNVVCNAFKASIIGLDLPLSVRLLLYKLFDTSCGLRLDTVYGAALKVMDAHGIHAVELEPAPPPTRSPYEAVPVAEGLVDESIEPPTLDHATRAALREIASPSGGYRPQDAKFAEELLRFADLEEDRPTVARVAPAQRMSLVGQMCNEILSDPHLPPGMRPLFERLRFPLIKIALADGTFYANRTHPVRRLVAEAAETAASSRVASHAVVRRLEERLRHIAEQIDLSATFVRPQIMHLQPLTMLEIASFLDQQREESETRRENVLNKVRRAVAQELEVHTLGRKPPAPLMHFLRLGWGPLMAARLLRHGMNSRSWIDAVNRLVQILASLDVVDATADQLAMREDILAHIARDLAEIGMRDDKVTIARDYLQRAYTENDERLAKMTPLERELQTHDFELLTPTETAAVLAEFPAPGSLQSRAPSVETIRQPLRTESRSDSLLDFVTPPPEATPPPPQNAPPARAATPAPSTPPAPTAAPAPAPLKAPAAPKAEKPVEPPKPAATRVEPAAAPPERAEAKAAPATPAPSQAAAPASPPAATTQANEPEIGQHTPEHELLTLCLTAESWFRVFDSSNGQTLWLKVSRYYPEHDSVGFNGFDAKKTLSIRASRFIQDLVSGRSEPVNASPVQMRAMAELRRRHKS